MTSRALEKTKHTAARKAIFTAYRTSANPLRRIRTRKPGKAIIVAFALFVLLSAGGTAIADINTPQGALDIAGILPGRYTFAEKKPGGENPDSASKQVPAIPSRPLTDVEIALKVACMLPQFDGSAPLTTVVKRNARGFIWPVEGFIYSTFNATRGRNRRHGAIDITSPKGTPVLAAADGIVTVVANGGKGYSGYGKIAIVDHGNGLHTVYAHCDSITVKMGQRVKQGEQIATVGRTGRATNNLLHFEVRVAGKKQDPLQHLPSRPDLVKAHNWKSK